MVGIVLAAALLFFLVRNMLIEPGNVLEITVDGEAYGTYSLQEDQTIEIRDGNICRIEGGEVSMIWATARTCSASIRRLWESMAEILSACPPGWCCPWAVMRKMRRWTRWRPDGESKLEEKLMGRKTAYLGLFAAAAMLLGYVKA